MTTKIMRKNLCAGKKWTALLLFAFFFSHPSFALQTQWYNMSEPPDWKEKIGALGTDAIYLSTVKKHGPVPVFTLMSVDRIQGVRDNVQFLRGSVGRLARRDSSTEDVKILKGGKIKLPSSSAVRTLDFLEYSFIRNGVPQRGLAALFSSTLKNHIAIFSAPTMYYSDLKTDVVKSLKSVEVRKER